MKKSFILFTFIFFHIGSVFSQYSVTVPVSDSVTGSPITDAKGEILGTGKVIFSGSNGLLVFEDIKPGNYILRINAEQFLTKEIKFSVSDTPVNIPVLLKAFESSTDTIDVRAKYYKRDETVSTSYTNTFSEEIRKTPGSGEDVVRYFSSAPGVSIGWDVYNAIIARGGSPVENLTVLDGLEIQNPNHYGTPGSTGGILSYINLKLVKDVDFYTGGFPPKYGGRISSVMDIKFREGSRQKQVRDVYISVIGAGVFLEGPVNGNSSYIVSARRSYLELVQSQLGMPLLPDYWDFNAKFNYNLSKSDKLSFTGIFAIDNANPYDNPASWLDDTVRVKLMASGIKYEKSGKNYTLNTTAGYNWNYYSVKYDNYDLDINDNEAYLKQEADVKLNKIASMNLYSIGRYIFSDYKINKTGGFNSSNYYSPSFLFDSLINTYKIAFGANLTCSVINNRLIINFGARFDKFGYILEDFTISPRLGLSYKLFNNTFVNASYGIYYQPPELIWVAADADNNKLKSIKADTYVLGAEHYFSEDIRLCAEAYLKQYQHYPVSVYDPNFIFINSGVDLYPNFLDKAVSAGKGYFGGIDITFQKKNPSYGLYWTLIYSYSKSKFLALIGDVQPALYDYTNQLTAILGIRFKNEFSFSGRFKYAGPKPYTPFDIDLSTQYSRGIYDKSRYNAARMPEYIRLDLRIDKMLNIGGSRLMLYFEVQNVFNRKNVFNYWWKGGANTVKADYHWTILPIGGISWQF